MGIRLGVTAFTLGGVAMYLFDPDRGRRRRALVRDKIKHSAHQIECAAAVTSSDIQNRTRGLAAGMKHLFAERPDSEVLVARVRSKIGRVVSHPSSVEVIADDGIITLRGPILEHEIAPLLSCAASVSGVRRVINELEPHLTAQGVPGLQGGVHRSGGKFELSQKNWSPTARLLTGLGGAAAMLYGLRRRDILSLTVCTTGFGLFVRALTNRELRRVAGLGIGRNTVQFEQTIQIAAPIDKVFAFWREFSNFPKFMTHVRKVIKQGETGSHWVIDGPAGVSIEWDAIITRLETNQIIAWKTVGEPSIDHAGIVKFTTAERDATVVHVQFFYNPPAGLTGHSIASLLGFDPKTKMNEDLARLKAQLESSEVPKPHTNAAQTGARG